MLRRRWPVSGRESGLVSNRDRQRFDERITVRRFFPGNDADGKPVGLIKEPNKDVPAYRRPGKVEGETYFFMHFAPLAGPHPESEIIDATGNVWGVKASDTVGNTYRHFDKDGKKTTIDAYRVTVTLKKKAPEKK